MDEKLIVVRTDVRNISVGRDIEINADVVYRGEISLVVEFKRGGRIRFNRERIIFIRCAEDKSARAVRVNF